MSATLKAYVFLITTTFCWGCNAVFSKLLVGHASPMLVVTLRWLGAVILIAIIARQAIIIHWPLLRAHAVRIFFMGAVGFTCFNALFYEAAHTTHALNIGIIQGAIPIFVLLGGIFVYKSSVALPQWTGVVVTVLGVMTLASSGKLSHLINLQTNKGDLLMLIACLFYASYALALRKFKDVEPLSLFALLAVSALFASIPLTAWEYASGESLWPTPKGWFVITLVTLLPSFIAQICFIRGVAVLGPARAGIFVNLVPVFGAILSMLVLHERFYLYHGIALFLVTSGIWLAEQKQGQAIKKPQVL